MSKQLLMSAEICHIHVCVALLLFRLEPMHGSSGGSVHVLMSSHVNGEFSFFQQAQLWNSLLLF